jgi:hypothetical protein
MKAAWCLAASNAEATAREITNYYARRWTIEPSFRDTKDLRFGMGLGAGLFSSLIFESIFMIPGVADV